MEVVILISSLLQFRHCSMFVCVKEGLFLVVYLWTIMSFVK